MATQEIIVLILLIGAVSFLGYKLYKRITSKGCEDAAACDCNLHGVKKQVKENHKNS